MVGPDDFEFLEMIEDCSCVGGDLSGMIQINIELLAQLNDRLFLWL
jgi:hypothetical protein